MAPNVVKSIDDEMVIEFCRINGIDHNELKKGG